MDTARHIPVRQYYTEAQFKKKEAILFRSLKRENQTQRDWYELVLARMDELELDKYFLMGDIGMTKPTALRFIRGEWDPYSRKQPEKQFIWRWRLSILLAQSKKEANELLAMSGYLPNGMDNMRDRAAMVILQVLEYPEDIGKQWVDIFQYNVVLLRKLIDAAEATGEIKRGELGYIL